MDQTSDNQNPGFVSRLKTWVTYPVTTQLDFLDVVLSTILIATVSFAWIAVLKHLTGEE